MIWKSHLHVKLRAGTSNAWLASGQEKSHSCNRHNAYVLAQLLLHISAPCRKHFLWALDTEDHILCLSFIWCLSLHLCLQELELAGQSVKVVATWAYDLAKDRSTSNIPLVNTSHLMIITTDVMVKRHLIDPLTEPRTHSCQYPRLWGTKPFVWSVQLQNGGIRCLWGAIKTVTQIWDFDLPIASLPLLTALRMSCLYCDWAHKASS